ncbi:MAG: LURP-one-related/scramblase family protein [Chloroflexota bacterium]
MLRHRREESESPAPSLAGGWNQYQMRERLISIGDDFTIQNASGQGSFFVDGKALRVRKTLDLKDMSGNTLYSIQERMANVRDTMKIEKNGQVVATVHKAMVTPVRDRFTIDVQGGQDLNVQGNITAHEYSIERNGTKVAEVSKRWFRVRDTYGVAINPSEDQAMILACTVCLDSMG